VLLRPQERDHRPQRADRRPRDRSDGDLTPPQVAFYNYVDHPWVARKKINREEIESTRIVLPAMVVYLEAAPTIDAEVRDDLPGRRLPGLVQLPLDRAGRGEADARRALHDARALPVLHAIPRERRQGHAPLRNNVALLFAKNPITPYTPMDSWEAAYLAAATTVTYRCREHLV
jgi:hypothetical protein